MSDTAFIARPPLSAGRPKPWLKVARTVPAARSAARDPAWSIPANLCEGNLAARIHAGEPAAIAEFSQQLFPVIIRLAQSLSPGETDTIDLAMHMIAGIVNQLQRRPDQLATLSCWAPQVAVRSALRRLKAGAARIGAPDWTPGERQLIQQLASGTADPHAVAAPARRLFSRLLTRLEPRHRLIVSLTEFEGLGAREIADLTGWPHWLTRLRAVRAQRAFERALASLIH